ncbi:MAG: xanthine dehydrogenase family protein molybdopterin-binding subunit, partial [Pseudomonadales bacterium]
GQVSIHMKRMGGSFGRRTSQEYVIEAVELSKRAGRPVKLTWNREDSVRYDFLREGGFTRLKGAIDDDGSVVAIEEHVIGVAPGGKPSRFTGPWASAFPFSTMKNIRASLTTRQMDTPVGPWRAPYSNTHAFASQSFFDELATLAGRDPIELMLELMGERRWITPDDVRALNTGRAIDVINTVAKKAQWGRPMPKGQGLGFAFYFCHAAHVAEIAEVSVDQNDRVTLHKVTAAVDVGPIINMSGAMSQVQGAIIDGYSTMAGQKITMENGRVQQTNLDQYPVLRIGQAPEIDVHFIQSDFDPTGLGEPALPPLAPAVANAIFAATGRRVRKMPISDVGFSV